MTLNTMNNGNKSTHGTTEKTLLVLSQVLLAKLEHKKLLEFQPKVREVLRSHIFHFLKDRILTDQAIHDMTRRSLNTQAEALQATEIADSQAYRLRKKALMEQYKDQTINGLYLTKSLRELALELPDHLVAIPEVDELYGSDEEIMKLTVDTVSSFDESNVS